MDNSSFRCPERGGQITQTLPSSSPILSPTAFKTPDPNVPFTCWRVCESLLRDSLCHIAKEPKGSEVVVFALHHAPNVDTYQKVFFDLLWMTIGKKVFAKPHISLYFTKHLQERIAMPFTFIPEKEEFVRTEMYCYKFLSGLERLQTTRAMQDYSFLEELTLKQALLGISGFAYANIRIVYANKVGRRIAEKLSPPPQRTEELSKAEMLCPNSYEIRILLERKRPIPLEILEEKECILVRDFYVKILDTNQIENAVLVYEQENIFSRGISASKQRKNSKTLPILGTIGIQRSSSAERSGRNFLWHKLQNPPKLGTLTVTELSEIETIDYQKNEAGKDELTEKRKSWLDAKNLLEYIQKQDLYESSRYYGISDNQISILRKHDEQKAFFLQRCIAGELLGRE